MNSIKLIIALSLTASVPTVLHAQTTDLATISVATADLNLATRAGQDRLAITVAPADGGAGHRRCHQGTDPRRLLLRVRRRGRRAGRPDAAAVADVGPPAPGHAAEAVNVLGRG